VRIVHVYKDYHPPVRGGIEQTIERLAREQTRAGHEVTVLTSAHGGRHTIDEHVDGVRVVRCAEWARYASAPLCPTMPVWLARLRAELFHLHFPNPTGEVSWLLARPRVPLVVTYHSDIVRQARALRLYGPFMRRILDSADVIMPTSDRYLEHSPTLREYREKCVVVPLGVDLECYEPVARRRNGAAVNGRAPRLLFVGRLRYYKGLDVLLRAMVDVPATLVIVGDGPEGEALRGLRTELKLEERVVFAGALNDEELLDQLVLADVGVLPSTWPSEAFGLAMIEMLACGIPVVCTELGTGTSFVNQHEQTGLVVPPRDAPALAAALNRLLASPDLRRRYGASGRRRAHELFSRQAMVRGVEDVYASALARKRNGVPSFEAQESPSAGR
jgi:rhamnosyl/mannosyltransferase